MFVGTLKARTPENAGKVVVRDNDAIERDTGGITATDDVAAVVTSDGVKESDACTRKAARLVVERETRRSADMLRGWNVEQLFYYIWCYFFILKNFFFHTSQRLFFVLSVEI